MTLFRGNSNAIDVMVSLGLTWFPHARNRLFFSWWDSNPPFPRGTHDGAQIGHGGLPAEDGLGLGGVRQQTGRNTRARGFDLHRDLAGPGLSNAVRSFQERKNPARFQ